MSRMLKVTLALAVGTVALAASKTLPVVDNTKAIEKAILKAHAEMVQAAKQSGCGRVLVLYPGCRANAYHSGRRFVQEQRGDIECYQLGFENTASIERNFDYTSVAVLSPTTAVVTGTGTSTVVTRSGRTISSRFATSNVFVLTHGQWKLLNGHYSNPNAQ